MNGLNNTIFVCKATNALGSGQGQVTILVTESPETEQRNLSKGAIGAIIFVVLVVGVFLTNIRCSLDTQAW